MNPLILGIANGISLRLAFTSEAYTLEWLAGVLGVGACAFILFDMMERGQP